MSPALKAALDHALGVVITVPLTQRSAAVRTGDSDGPDPTEASTDTRKSIADLVRTALARGLNVQLKRRDGSIFCVYPPIVIATETIQFQSTAGVAQKPIILGFDEIIAVQPR